MGSSCELILWKENASVVYDFYLVQGAKVREVSDLETTQKEQLDSDEDHMYTNQVSSGLQISIHITDFYKYLCIQFMSHALLCLSNQCVINNFSPSHFSPPHFLYLFSFPFSHLFSSFPPSPLFFMYIWCCVLLFPQIPTCLNWSINSLLLESTFLIGTAREEVGR